ncbi:MAG TPA: DUF721 domain-containing protein [Kofleriaceae bacterium]|nr:DUF721 domain-containing protein [Kofleriaceae bacterium]
MARHWNTGPRDKFDRAKGMVAVRDLIKNVVNYYRLNADIRQEMLFAEWSSFVGDRIGARTRPDTIIDRTLIVEVATSAWLHELRLIRPKIVSDMLDKLGLPRFFDDIRFVLAGERRRRGPEVRRPAPRKKAEAAPPPPMPAVGEDLRKILDDTSKIEDEELRALVSRVRVKNDR